MTPNENDSNNNNNRLKIELYGGLRLFYKGDEWRLANRKAKGLFCALALAEQPRLERRWLRGHFWSMLDEERAAGNLRQVLHFISKNIIKQHAFDGITIDSEAIEIDPRQIEVDCLEFISLIEQVQLDKRLLTDTNYFEKLAFGLDGLDPAFGEWLTGRRNQLQNETLLLIEKKMNGTQATSAVKDLARIILNYDPLHEQACRKLMWAFAADGDVANALSVYQSFWNDVDEAFGEEPSKATQELAVSIKNGEIQGSSALSTTALPTPGRTQTGDRRPRISVEPIDSRTLDTRTERLMTGLRLDLLSNLVRFREWRVRDGEDGNTADMDYSLRLRGYEIDGQLAVSISLLDCKTSDIVWSERIIRSLEHWSQRHVEVVRRLAVAVNVQIEVDRIARNVNAGDYSLDVYDRWLCGQELMMSYTPDNWREAENVFDRLISSTPNFSRAISSRAAIENLRHLTFPGHLPTVRSTVLALELAQRAVSLDPLDSRAQLHLGWAAAMSGQFTKSELAFSLAHTNNENDPWTIVSAAIGLAFCDRMAAAHKLLKIGLELELEPSPAYWSYVAAVNFLDKDYEACIEASERSEEITADVPAWHAAAHAHLGNFTEAQHVLNRFIAKTVKLWQGAAKATEPAIAHWVLASFPIRNPAAWRRFRDGLEMAGMELAQEEKNAAGPAALLSEQALISRI